jgi:dienelactone hydrolase
MSRNLSINAHFLARAKRHVPRFRFAPGQDFGRWQSELLSAARATLGEMPKRVPLNPEIQAEWREDGLIKQRVIFDVEEGLSAVAYVFRPERHAGKLPAILACHGHGPFGKEAVMGNRSSSPMVNEIVNHHYDYGLQMARAGFAVIAIDWRGFGERDDRRKPNHSDVDSQHAHKRDLCNVHYLRATVLGGTVLGMDVHDGICALDYLCQQDFVDPQRIGAMGLSFGGTMTIWMAICDARIKAANVICYSDRFADFGMRDVNFCGSQITPGLYELCDVPDLQGLIAPRPLLVEIGAYDECFKVDSAMSCFREVEKIYEAAAVRDRLELDLFEGGHRWGGNLSLQFFRRWLGNGAMTVDGSGAREVEVSAARKLTLNRAVLREVSSGGGGGALPISNTNSMAAAPAAPFSIGGGGGGDGIAGGPDTVGGTEGGVEP